MLKDKYIGLCPMRELGGSCEKQGTKLPVIRKREFT